MISWLPLCVLLARPALIADPPIYTTAPPALIPGPDGVVPVFPSLQPLYGAVWGLAASTIAMPCNTSGWLDPAVTAPFGTVDVDWSNAKQQWAAAPAMDCQERLVEQAARIAAAQPRSKVWVYRNIVKALPWFKDVREKLADPQYSGFFLRYRPSDPARPYLQPNTGNSTLYHDLGQTPATYAPGACGDGVPCGEYLYDHRNGSMLREWLVETVIGGPDAMGNENVSGLFLDDFWSNYPFLLPWSNGDCSTGAHGGASEEHGGCDEDTGLGAADVQAIAAGWRATLQASFEKIVALGGYSWQMLQFPDGSSGSRTTPRGAGFFRSACVDEANATKMQRDPLMLRFSDDGGGATAPQFEQDVAAFLLIRGPHAHLGFSWSGCSSEVGHYGALTAAQVELLNRDFGEPTDARCAEVAPGVFQRRWEGAVVQLDTNANKANITMVKRDTAV